MENDRIKVPIGNGLFLVAMQNNGDYDKEVFVGIENEVGAWVQDLAMVRPAYTYGDGFKPIWSNDKFEVLVWDREDHEDFTETYEIGLCDNSEEGSE